MVRFEQKIPVTGEFKNFACGLACLVWACLSWSMGPQARAAGSDLLRLPEGWRLASELMTGFPVQGLQLFVCDQASAPRPLRAYALAWDPTVPNISFKPVLQSAGRTPTQFYTEETGRVFAAANGGYFGGGQSYSLVMQGGNVLAANIKALSRTYLGTSVNYYPTRVAFGLTPSGRLTTDWIYHVGAGNAQIYAYPTPSANALGQAPQPVPSAAFPAGGNPWTMTAAIGGSPMLLRDGVVRISDQEELIDINNTTARPRTALGYTASGVAVLLVVEGDNAPGPAGVNLAELAALLQALGCTQAINLDGGGSTSLVVGGRTTVRPSGGAERAVASAVLWVDPRTQTVATSAPSLLHEPWAVTLAKGSRGDLHVVAQGGGLSYQWLYEGATLPGETEATLTLAGTDWRAGRYSVRVTNRLGSVTSRDVTVEATAAGPSTLINLSVRALGGSGEDTLIAGFVVRDANKEVLVRAIGPGLKAFGVTDSFGDPRLELSTANGTNLAYNDNWLPRDTETVGTRVGAFALQLGSSDAALVANTRSGGHLATVTGREMSDRGNVLLELYDAGGPGALTNVSARARISPQTGPLIAGFVVRGPAALTVLVRAIGPSLAAFGVRDFLAAPRLTLVKDGVTLQVNTAWASAPNALEIWAAGRATGAFSIPAGSQDSALLVTLPPGGYTAIVSAADEGSGVALVEVYEVR
ncbi:MAG: phosphodiester glycosidase family protein [Opitutaceae bacterium]|nr:phosphodiester glycosidase family protein [Opitutaceae bacterium]